MKPTTKFTRLDTGALSATRATCPLNACWNAAAAPASTTNTTNSGRKSPKRFHRSLTPIATATTVRTAAPARASVRRTRSPGPESEPVDDERVAGLAGDDADREQRETASVATVMLCAATNSAPPREPAEQLPPAQPAGAHGAVARPAGPSGRAQQDEDGGADQAGAERDDRDVDAVTDAVAELAVDPRLDRDVDADEHRERAGEEVRVERHAAVAPARST